MVLIGDINDDGFTDSIDATYILRYNAELRIPIDSAEVMYGDVDGSGDVDVVDATYIQRYLAEFTIPYAIGKPLV